MIKVLFAITVVLVFNGCTTKSIEFMDNNVDEESHNKALEFLGTDRSDKGYTYKATEKAKQCLKDRIAKDGYYTLQADIDCYNNSIAR